MISVVIPVYNEEQNLKLLMKRLRHVLRGMQRPFEIIMIDDGSRDDSLAVLKSLAAKEPALRVVELTRNYGQHAAIMAGFSIVRGDIVVTLDADLQNPPEEIPNLVHTMEKGKYDVVGSIRKGRKDSLFRILPSKVINQVARKITGVKMSDWGCMLRAYRRPVVERMIACHEHATFIPALATVFGKRITEIEVAHEERHGGVSNYPLRKFDQSPVRSGRFLLEPAHEDAHVRRHRHVAPRYGFRPFPDGGPAVLRGRLGRPGRLHTLCHPVRLCGLAVFRPGVIGE